jgi:hypothetical protein
MAFVTPGNVSIEPVPLLELLRKIGVGQEADAKRTANPVFEAVGMEREEEPVRRPAGLGLSRFFSWSPTRTLHDG